jgi:hypothetical protein
MARAGEVPAVKFVGILESSNGWIAFWPVFFEISCR